MINSATRGEGREGVLKYAWRSGRKSVSLAKVSQIKQRSEHRSTRWMSLLIPRRSKLPGFHILWISTARCNGPPFFIFISFFILLNCLPTFLLLPLKNFCSWKPIFWLSSCSLQSKWSRAHTLLQQLIFFLSPAHLVLQVSPSNKCADTAMVRARRTKAGVSGHGENQTAFATRDTTEWGLRAWQSCQEIRRGFLVTTNCFRAFVLYTC